MIQSDGYGFKRVSKKQMKRVMEDSIENSKHTVKSSKVVVKNNAKSITSVINNKHTVKSGKVVVKNNAKSITSVDFSGLKKKKLHIKTPKKHKSDGITGKTQNSLKNSTAKNKTYKKKKYRKISNGKRLVNVSKTGIKSVEKAITEDADQTVGTNAIKGVVRGYRIGVKSLRSLCIGLKKSKNIYRKKNIHIRAGKAFKNIVSKQAVGKGKQATGNVGGTFDYLNDNNNQKQYTYQFKRKGQKNGNSNLKNSNPIQKLNKANKNQMPKSQSKLGKTTRSIKSLSNTNESKSDIFFNRNRAYKKSEEERASIGSGNTVIRSITDKIVDRLKKYIIIKLGLKFAPVLLGGMILFIVSITPALCGTVVIMEGYAVVVEFVDEVVDKAKNFFDNICNFAGDTWDTVKTLWTDTHGADKVNLDDMISVDEFMKSMCEYERNKITEVKGKYESDGYTVTLYYHSGLKIADDDVSNGSKEVATGGSEFNGATKKTIKYCWKMIREKGFTEEATAGLIGNMCQETSGIDPNAGTSHYGIIQWDAGRKSNLISWCSSHGYDWTTRYGQLRFVLDAELKSRLGKRYKKFKNMKSVIDAADLICVYYEGAAGQQQPNRRKYAQNSYNLCAGMEVKQIDEVEDDEEEDDYEITLDSLYSEEEFAKVLKPLWLSVMYGKYDFEPNQIEMAETAEDIGDMINNYTVAEDSAAKTVTIYIYAGSIDEVLQKYYLDDIEKLKNDDENQEKYVKLENDYAMAQSLLEYYESYDIAGAGTGAGTKAADQFLKTYGIKEASNNEDINKMIKLALSKVGNKYEYGGSDPDNGIDCSGYVQWCYKQIGVSLPRTSKSQAGVGKEVSSTKKEPGDLCFYGNGSTVSHVALYIGSGYVVHASNSAPYPKGGIKISKWNYRKTLHIRRIIN